MRCEICDTEIEEVDEQLGDLCQECRDSILMDDQIRINLAEARMLEIINEG